MAITPGLVGRGEKCPKWVRDFEQTSIADEALSNIIDSNNKKETEAFHKMLGNLAAFKPLFKAKATLQDSVNAALKL